MIFIIGKSKFTQYIHHFCPGGFSSLITFCPKEIFCFNFFLFFSLGIPPQHAPLGPPSSYYGGQEPHHKYHENGHHPPHHENFSDFVTLVCQETAQHQAAHHPQAHQAAHHLRSPYAGYAPPLPPVSSSATASHRANIGRTHGKWRKEGWFLTELLSEFGRSESTLTFEKWTYHLHYAYLRMVVL